ncbi:MAG: hypothetical protein K6G85_11195 [Eubacterium sp.]|nr:hypothetical protein [Eubacterium sp.]
MGKLTKEEVARREGMSYALRIAKEKGIDDLEADLKMRNAIDLPVRCSKKDLDAFSNAAKVNILYHVKVLMAVTLHDEFGFGNTRLKRFLERFDKKASCFEGDYTDWEMQVQILAEECGIVIEDDTRDINVKV